MPPKPQPRHTLSYQLREIVESRGMTPYHLGQLADVDPGVVSRWMGGRRDIRMETADKLALALGVRLTELARPVVVRKPTRPAKPVRPHPTPDVGQLAEDAPAPDGESEAPGGNEPGPVETLLNVVVDGTDLGQLADSTDHPSTLQNLTSATPADLSKPDHATAPTNPFLALFSGGKPT